MRFMRSAIGTTRRNTIRNGVIRNKIHEEIWNDIVNIHKENWRNHVPGMTENTTAIREVTYSELLTKQTMRRNCTYLSYFSAKSPPELRRLSCWGISFVCLCQKVCRLWAQPRFDSFHQLIMVEGLWFQPVLQVGKQVVVAQRDQGCKGGGQTTPGWNVSVILKCNSCMWMRIVFGK
jgi:hypothetical protein